MDVGFDALLRLAHFRWGNRGVPMAFSFVDQLTLQTPEPSDILLETACGRKFSTTADLTLFQHVDAAHLGDMLLRVQGSRSAKDAIVGVVGQADTGVLSAVVKGVSELGAVQTTPVKVAFDHLTQMEDDLVDDIWRGVSERISSEITPLDMRWRAVFRYPIDQRWQAFLSPSAAGKSITDEPVCSAGHLIEKVFASGLVGIGEASSRRYAAIPLAFWGAAAWLVVLIELAEPKDAESTVTERLQRIRLWYSIAPFESIREYLPHRVANAMFHSFEATLNVDRVNAHKRLKTIALAVPPLTPGSADTDRFREVAGFDVSEVFPSAAALWRTAGRFLGSGEEAWSSVAWKTFVDEFLKPATSLAEATRVRGGMDLSYEMTHEIGQVSSLLVPAQEPAVVLSAGDFFDAHGENVALELLRIDGYVVPYGSLYKGAANYIELMSQASGGTRIFDQLEKCDFYSLIQWSLEHVIAPAAFAIRERGKQKGKDQVGAFQQRAESLTQAVLTTTLIDPSISDISFNRSERSRLVAQMFLIAILNAVKHSCEKADESRWTMHPVVVWADTGATSAGLSVASRVVGSGQVSSGQGTLRVLQSLATRATRDGSEGPVPTMGLAQRDVVPANCRDSLNDQQVFRTIVTVPCHVLHEERGI